MKPNFVVFLVDQLRRDALSCYGNPICRTPSIDGLAAEGARFENAFTVSPVCSPSRASLLTGLYPHNHGVMLNTHIAPAWCRGLQPATPTFSGVLRDAGYALDYVGKWHVHQDLPPTAFGFDRHENPGIENRRIVPGTETTIDFPGGKQLVCATHALPKQECDVWRFAEAGIRMIRERAASGRPFFLRIDTPQPHFPNIVPKPYASMYDPREIPPWPNFGESYAGKPAAQVRKHREWHLEDKGWDWWSRVVAGYYGDVSYIDECVGRVIEAVDDCGLADNTVFVFATDHGDAVGSHRHFEKAGTMYDEIYRIPLIVRMPRGRGFPAETSPGQFVRLMDLMPTFCELAGAEPPRGIDARSLAAVLHGRDDGPWPDSVYGEHHGEVWGYHSQRMVRTRRWKYVYDPHDLDELYDLSSDPWELRNLAGERSHAAVLDEMRARLLGWNDATRDMFTWKWLRWSFPQPVPPDEATASRLPLTC